MRRSPVQSQFSESEARARTGPSDSTSRPANPTICLYSNELLIRVLMHSYRAFCSFLLNAGRSQSGSVVIRRTI
ncbi:unnamed protein product [Gadus morhua 'NCC']